MVPINPRISKMRLRAHEGGGPAAPRGPSAGRQGTGGLPAAWAGADRGTDVAADGGHELRADPVHSSVEAVAGKSKLIRCFLACGAGVVCQLDPHE